MAELSCDVLIVGGGTGGCAAAMAACSQGLRVILTEETDWIGGQLTAQAVPPDEHRWIEKFGCTGRYRAYRNAVRAYYRANRPLTADARNNPLLNPGGGWVSRLCHEPKVALAVLTEMLQPAIGSGLLDIRLRTVPTSAAVNLDRIESVSLRDLDSGQDTEISARFFLDATELGDLLPLAGAEYIIGAESKSQTGEPHAVDGPPQPDNVQAVTWVPALGFDEGSNRIIDKPEQYDRWRAFRPSFWPGPLLGFEDLDPQTGQPRSLPLFSMTSAKWSADDGGWFNYRQILNPTIYFNDAVNDPATLANWPQNDYTLGSILDVPAETKAQRLEDAKQLSLSLLFWLQTEAPRPDGGAGYSGLYLNPDITGTDDGLAKAPYIREARRIEAQFIVLEQHVATACNPGLDRAPALVDRVGIGCYRIDLHPSTSGASYVNVAALPFQIPLKSLVPVRVKNLIPACKNLGVSHIANGCYRLHPVEWNIGESAGLLAAYSIRSDLEIQQITGTRDQIAEFQSLLIDEGIEIEWPHDADLRQ